MRGPDLVIAGSFWHDHREELVAAATVLAAVAVAELIDQTIKRRARALDAVLPGEGLSPAATTRLRLIRRLVFATILLLGVGLALTQFEDVRRLAAGVLASSAVLGLVVGFAARQTLANVVAGLLLVITQPIRIGDLVTFEEHTGSVEDIRLSYTFLRCSDGRRVIVPNERLAQSTIENHTIMDPRTHVEVSLWIPLGADTGTALDALQAEPGVDARVAAVDKDGVTLVAGAWAEAPDERDALAARIRARGLERLRGEGLFSEAPS